MKPIAIFYHCLLFRDSPDNLLEHAVTIVREQMQALADSGLTEAASQIHVGLNGGLESLLVSKLLFPAKATYTTHGLQCHNENRSIMLMESWRENHPDWYVLYFHSKGGTHGPDHDFSTTWRKCMMRHVVGNWRGCVKELDNGCDAVGSHWMEPPATPKGHHIFAGNFWWATSNFLKTLPLMELRDRIKQSGIDSVDSRYEAEVWLGNGPRAPKVKDWHPNWNPSKIETCKF